MTMWHEAARNIPDRERLRRWIAEKLYQVHHESRGDSLSLSDAPEEVQKRWLGRATRLIVNL